MLISDLRELLLMFFVVLVKGPTGLFKLAPGISPIFFQLFNESILSFYFVGEILIDETHILDLPGMLTVTIFYYFSQLGESVFILFNESFSLQQIRPYVRLLLFLFFKHCVHLHDLSLAVFECLFQLFRSLQRKELQLMLFLLLQLRVYLELLFG